ncbi:MAG TPA: YraN family protein [Candidatus Acidoferrales bacterium]|nr:YraN family protein [Candidatus Acidoferrales bacterium]
MFGLVSFASRRGIRGAGGDAPPGESQIAAAQRKHRARSTGIRGETFAYWYLRRHGYVIIASNYAVPGWRGEIDLIGFDGPVLAFVEVKTRTGSDKIALPENKVDAEKRRSVSRMARRYLREFGRARTPYRFDILAIESRTGQKPLVRLHKGAFSEHS